MSKILRIILIIILAPLTVMGVIFIFCFFSDYYRTEWFKRTDNGFSIVGKAIGEPSWGGTTRALIELYEADKNKLLNQFETTIDTNGNSLTEQNYEISINNNHIALVLYNYDNTICGAYRFYYEDYIEDISIKNS